MNENIMIDVRAEYMSRINLVQDYIDANLAEDISLTVLADVSGFSKYHFHRIFSSVMKETLYQYITRQRLERAQNLLVHSPRRTMTDIAYLTGFSDSAMFARLFKKHYGMSATVFKKNVRKNRQAIDSLPSYNEKNEWREISMDFLNTIKVEDIPELTVIYLRHVGTYESLGKVFHKMIKRLIGWAIKSGIASKDDNKLLAIYHDNPEITKDEKRRVSIGLTVPKQTASEDDFGKMSVAAGKYAVGYFEIDDDKAAEQQQAAWQYMFGTWLPDSGYQPADGVVFEEYANNPMEHPERKHLINIYLPVKPL